VRTLRRKQYLILLGLLAVGYSLWRVGWNDKRVPESEVPPTTRDDPADAPAPLASRALPVAAKDSEKGRKPELEPDQLVTLLVRFYDATGAAVTPAAGDAVGLQAQFRTPWTTEPADATGAVRITVRASALLDESVSVFWRIRGFFHESASLTRLHPATTRDTRVVEVNVHVRPALAGEVRLRIVDLETSSPISGGSLICFRGRQETVIAVSGADGLITARVDDGMDKCFVEVPGYWPFRVSMPALDEAIDAGVVLMRRAPEPSSLIVHAVGASSTARLWVHRIGLLDSPGEDYAIDLTSGRVGLNNARGGTESREAAWSSVLGARREDLLPGLYGVVVRDPTRGAGSAHVRVSGATIASIPLDIGGSITVGGIDDHLEILAEAVGDRSGRRHIERGGRIDYVPPGLYDVYVRPVVHEPGERTLVAKDVEVRRGETANLGGTSAVSRIRVFGRIVTEGEPLRDLEIRLAPGGKVATTDADGRFLFDGVSLGTYYISLRGYRISSAEKAYIRLTDTTKGEEDLGNLEVRKN
jgi:hypothetical protein